MTMLSAFVHKSISTCFRRKRVEYFCYTFHIFSKFLEQWAMTFLAGDHKTRYNTPESRSRNFFQISSFLWKRVENIQLVLTKTKFNPTCQQSPWRKVLWKKRNLWKLLSFDKNLFVRQSQIHLCQFAGLHLRNLSQKQNTK